MKVAIMGMGKLGVNLAYHLRQLPAFEVQCFNRTPNLAAQIQPFDAIEHLATDTQVIFLCVNDQQIEAILKEIAQKCAHLKAYTYCLHTSGSVGLQALADWGEKIGVFYPLQTFTKEKMADLGTVPIFCEEKGRNDFVRGLAKQISTHVFWADSAQRRQIHLGAVFACNFTHYLYRIAAQLLPNEANIEVYRPLIEEQLAKVFLFGAENTQTGPAIRGDKNTIKTHLAMLQSHPQWQEIYRMMSQAINPASVETAPYIRSYRAEDKSAIMEIFRLNSPQYFAPEEEADLLFYLENEIEQYFVVELAGQIVGCGGINFPSDKQTVVLSWDIIRPEHQGKGFGRQLLQHRLQWIQTYRPQANIVVRTSQWVYLFYQKNGFQLVEVIENYWAEGFDLYKMAYLKSISENK